MDALLVILGRWLALAWALWLGILAASFLELLVEDTQWLSVLVGLGVAICTFVELAAFFALRKVGFTFRFIAVGHWEVEYFNSHLIPVLEDPIRVRVLLFRWQCLRARFKRSLVELTCVRMRIRQESRETSSGNPEFVEENTDRSRHVWCDNANADERSASNAPDAFIAGGAPDKMLTEPQSFPKMCVTRAKDSFINMSLHVVIFGAKYVSLSIDGISVRTSSFTHLDISSIALLSRPTGPFAATFEFSVEQVSLRDTQLDFNVQLDAGLKIRGKLTPHIRTVFRSRKLSVLDDLTVSLFLPGITARVGSFLLQAERIRGSFCLGLSNTAIKVPSAGQEFTHSMHRRRSLTFTQHTTDPRPLLQYWSITATMSNLSMVQSSSLHPMDHTGLILAASQVSASSEARKEKNGFVAHSLSIREIQAGTLKGLERSGPSVISLLKSSDSRATNSSLAELAQNPTEIALIGCDLSVAAERAQDGFVVDFKSNGIGVALEPVSFSDRLSRFLLDVRNIDRKIHRKERTKSAPTKERSKVTNIRRASQSRSAALHLHLGPLMACIASERPVGEADVSAVLISVRDTKGSRIKIIDGLVNKTTITGNRLVVSRLNENKTETELKLNSLSVIKASDENIYFNSDGATLKWNPDLEESLIAMWGTCVPIMKILRSSRQPTKDSSRREQKSNRAQLSGTNIEVEARFPDGAALSVSLGSLGPLRTGDIRWSGRDVTFAVQQTKMAYVRGFSISNPIESLSKEKTPRELDLNLQGVRVLIEAEFHFGNRWADFQTRLKGYIADRKARAALAGRLPSPKAMIDLRIKVQDTKLFLEDSPLNEFLTSFLPLMQDEAHQRVNRWDLFRKQYSNLESSLMPERTHELWLAFLRQNSEIYCSRAQALRRASNGFDVGHGLKTLAGSPLATLTINEFAINMFREGKMLENNGTEEYMRLHSRMDATPPDISPVERLDPRAWVSNGFRRIEWHFQWSQLHLRDYPRPSFSVKDLRFSGTAGLAQQRSTEPFVLRTTVALGRHRVSDISRPLASTKLFLDVDITAKSLHMVWNGAYLPAFMDFTRRASAFSGDGKDLSPRMPWFDTLRLNMHGKVRLRLDHLVGLMDATESPYSAMKNPVELSSSNVVLGIDRQVIYQEAPVHLGMQNVQLRPQSLSQERFPSAIRLESIEVFHTIAYRCTNEHSSMHYVHPFPSIKSKIEDSVIVRRVNSLPRIPLVVRWRSPTYVAGWDTYRTFRTNSYDMAVRVHVSHGESESVLYSDGISNLSKVTRRLVGMPIHCRHATKPVGRFDRKPSREGIGSLLSSISIDVTATHLKLLAWNNLVPGDGISLEVRTVVFSQKKEREHGQRERKLFGRHISVGGVSADIYTREADIGKDEEEKGFLLQAEDIAFVTEPQARDSNPKSGFGRQTKSPFHSFGGIKEYRRGEEVEALVYENRLVVTGIKVFWSPARYVSVFEWPRAFRAKSFTIATKQLADARLRIKREREKVAKMGIGTRRQRADQASGSLLHILEPDVPETESVRRPTSDLQAVSQELTALDDANAVFDLELHGAQFLFASQETRGVVILFSKYCSLGLIRRVRDYQEDEAGQVAREIRFHFNRAQIYTLTPNISQYVKFRHGQSWIPTAEDSFSFGILDTLPFHQMTASPFTLNGVHMAFFAEETDSVNARPSALLINTQALEFNSDGFQFRAFVDVITKVLMKRHPLNQQNQRELASLKYRMQLAGVRRPMISELQAHAIKLRAIVRIFDYSIDTARAQFVEDLLPVGKTTLLRHTELFEEIRATRNEYMAKLNAVNIYLRKEHKTDAELYPTMFLSYSFDRVRWALFEDRQNSPVVEVRLQDLVFRHIFYVGRIQHQEFTFAGVEIRSMDAGERKILRPDRSDEAAAGNSLIKSSDDSVVLFQWYAMQMERVGGISVYENLTIHVAPLEICITKRLIDSIRGFLFPGSEEESAAIKRKKSWRSRKSGLAVPTIFRRSGSERRYSRTTDQQVLDMAERGRSTVFFKYIYIGEFRLNASFKGREDGRHKVWDITNLSLSAPSYMYHSKTWTWKDFFDQVKRDVIMTVLKRGVTNLARSKLNLKQKLDPALGREIWHQYRNLFRGSDDSSNSDKASEAGDLPELEDLDIGPGIDGTLLPLEPAARRAACLELLYGLTESDSSSKAFPRSASLIEVHQLDDRDDGEAQSSLGEVNSSGFVPTRF